MKLPRWIHKLYAKTFAYFWLPCPICGRMFGGHEVRKHHGFISTWPGGGKCICPACSNKQKAGLLDYLNHRRR